MNVNADFDRRAVVHAGSIPWVPSPMPGVERRMLDRIGDEVARATSIVRYAPGSAFSAHTHTGGEEFYVLDGVFQDEHGDFPAGTYVRNPPTSSHTPRSDPGATIWVKLWQFDMEDRHQMTVDKNQVEPVRLSDTLREIPLYHDARETVRIEIWDAAADIEVDDHKGLEILVLEGGFTSEGEQFSIHSWIRIPIGERFAAKVGAQGAMLLVKSDHLSELQLAQSDRS